MRQCYSEYNWKLWGLLHRGLWVWYTVPVTWERLLINFQYSMYINKMTSWWKHGHARLLIVQLAVLQQQSRSAARWTINPRLSSPLLMLHKCNRWNSFANTIEIDDFEYHRDGLMIWPITSSVSCCRTATAMTSWISTTDIVAKPD